MHVPKLTVLLSFSALSDEDYELVFQEGTLLIQRERVPRMQQ
jgi:hypothetical protein